MALFNKYRRTACLLLIFALLATWLCGVPPLLFDETLTSSVAAPSAPKEYEGVAVGRLAGGSSHQGSTASPPAVRGSDGPAGLLPERWGSSADRSRLDFMDAPVSTHGYINKKKTSSASNSAVASFLFPLPLICPMDPLSTWNRTTAANATMFSRIVHPFLMANRTVGPSSPQRWENAAAARSADGPQCFGEIAGLDYNSGREHDLVELRGATLDLCLHMCLQRNHLLDEKLRALKHSHNDTQWAESFGSKRCAAVVHYAHGKICWLKRQGPLQKKMTDANSYVLGAQLLPLTRGGPTSLMPSDQDIAGYATISATSTSSDPATGEQPALMDWTTAGRRLPDDIRGASTSLRKNTDQGEQQQQPHVVAPNSLVLYAVLSEHHYIPSRMVPALQTWLRDEHVVVLLVNSTAAEQRRSEELLRPVLSFRATPATVRVVMYLKRNSLHDIPQDPNTPKTTVEALQRRLYAKGDGGMTFRRPLNNVPMLQSRAAREALDKRLRHILSRNNLHRQWDRGEFRLAKDSGAWKDLPGVDAVFGRFRNYSFYMIIDDDAYIIQRNFQILLSSFYLSKWNPWNTTIYSGVLSLWYQPVSENRAVVVPFIQGGAGILMSNAAMARAHPAIQRCRFACDYLPHGDVRLGCCMKSVVKVDPFYETTFWHMHVYRAQGRDVRQNRSLFPVSFHRIKNASMMMPLHDCVVAEEARLDGMVGASLAAPVTWDAVIACYEWMRGHPQHEYKFAMQELH